MGSRRELYLHGVGGGRVGIEDYIDGLVVEMKELWAGGFMICLLCIEAGCEIVVSMSEVVPPFVVEDAAPSCPSYRLASLLSPSSVGCCRHRLAALIVRSEVIWLLPASINALLILFRHSTAANSHFAIASNRGSQQRSKGRPSRHLYTEKGTFSQYR